MALVLGVGACSDMPTRFLAPEVPLVVQLPLVDSLLTLQELIADTTQLHIEPGSGNLSLALAGELTPVILGKELGRIDTLRFERSFQLNDIAAFREHFQGWSHGALELPLRSLFPQIPQPPAEAVVPPIAAPVQIDSILRLPEEILAVAYRAGTAELRVENRYPVPIRIEAPAGYSQPGIVLRTPGYGEWFVPVSAAQQVIPPGESRGQSTDPGGPLHLPLAGVVLSAETQLSLSLSSPGSGGQRVAYSSESVLRVVLQPSGVELVWARVLPSSAWEAELPVEVPLPNDAALSGGTFHLLALRTEVENGFPIALRGEWRFGQLRRNGTPVRQTFSLGAGERREDELVLQGPLALVPETEDQGVIRTLRLRSWVQLPPAAEPVTLQAEHGVTVRVVVDTVAIAWAEGRQLPVASFPAQAESEVWLQGNLGLLSQVEVEFAELLIEAQLENTAAVGFRVEGTIEVADRNRGVLARLPVPPQTVQPAVKEAGILRGQQTRWELRYTGVRLTERPRFVRFLWTVVPEADQGWAFADTSRLRGNVTVLIPVRMRIQQLRYENQWAWTGGEVLRRQGQKLERATLVVEVKNRFPVGLQLFVVFSDSLGSVRVPPEGELVFGAAPVEASGVAVREQHSIERIELDERHLPGILHAQQVALTLVGRTEAADYVRVRSSDYVHLRVMLRAEMSLP